MNRRRAFVLPMILVFLLIAGALITASFDIATQSQNQALQMVTTQELFNSAQSGIEWGKAQLLKHRDSLDTASPRQYDGTLSDLNATYTSGLFSYRVWDEKQAGPETPLSIGGVEVRVSILDCNYTLSGTPSTTDDLPPQKSPVGTGSETGGNNTGYRSGTTALMDPYRVTTSGMGGYSSHYYVIRSTATRNGRKKTLETMVVING